MKQIKFLLLIIGLATFSMTSCKKDNPCDNITCLNGAACDDGTCLCTEGFEGETCNIEQRAKFLGSWSGTQSCIYDGETETDDVDSFNVLVGSNITEVFLNIDGTNILATISGSTITVAPFTLDGDTISGDGSISNNVLTLNFTISYTEDGIDYMGTCIFTLTK